MVELMPFFMDPGKVNVSAKHAYEITMTRLGDDPFLPHEKGELMGEEAQIESNSKVHNQYKPLCLVTRYFFLFERDRISWMVWRKNSAIQWTGSPLYKPARSNADFNKPWYCVYILLIKITNRVVLTIIQTWQGLRHSQHLWSLLLYIKNICNCNLKGVNWNNFFYYFINNKN